VRFTLTYEGRLLSRGSAQHKEDIRQTFHPQMRELWTHNPLSIHPDYLLPDPAEGRLSVLMKVGEHVYAPLVSNRLCLLAELDILLLRPERPGGIVTSGGDIDNRLKTLFDALKVPTHPQDIAEGATPSSNESPTFTLLEDDDLIARVNVDTDRLLAARHRTTSA
jgi:Holliday junction resolvase RusA-like endonuclease